MNGITRDLAEHATNKCSDAIMQAASLCDQKDEQLQMLALISYNVLNIAAGIMAAEYMIKHGMVGSKTRPDYATQVRAVYVALGEAMEANIKARAGG